MSIYLRLAFVTLLSMGAFSQLNAEANSIEDISPTPCITPASEEMSYEALFKRFFPDGEWNNGQPILQGDNVVLRPFSLESVEQVNLAKAMYMSSEQMAGYADGRPRTAEQLLNILSRYDGRWKNPGLCGAFVAYKKENGKETPIGILGAGFSGLPGASEPYALFSLEYRDQGMGRASFNLLSQWIKFLYESRAPVIQEKPLYLMITTVSPDNFRVIHLLEKFGFVPVLDLKPYQETCIVPEDTEFEIREINGVLTGVLAKSRHGVQKALFEKRLAPSDQ